MARWQWGAIATPVLLGTILLLGGCGGSDPGGPAAAPPPPSVTVVQLTEEPVTETQEFVGRVVAAERGRWGEARHLFQTAFALDSGRSEEIRTNLRLALANLENSGYTSPNNHNFALVRRGQGRFLLLSAS